MNRSKRIKLVFQSFLVVAMFAAVRPWGAQAQDKDAKSADKAAEAPASPAPKEESSVTDHSIKIGAQTIPYKATAATILLKNEKDEPIALLYSTAYTRSDVKDPSTRPIAFVYNGGPGSASVWLHMGSFSPKRVATVNATPHHPLLTS
jgi:carboxypeptidase C (cathepsin A)